MKKHLVGNCSINSIDLLGDLEVCLTITLTNPCKNCQKLKAVHIGKQMYSVGSIWIRFWTCSKQGRHEVSLYQDRVQRLMANYVLPFWNLEEENGISTARRMLWCWSKPWKGICLHKWKIVHSSKQLPCRSILFNFTDSQMQNKYNTSFP